MSPLARLLAARGEEVIGSDRSFDQGRNLPFFEQLRAEGIRLVPQDGSGLDSSIDHFIVTRAVEEAIPDVRRARELGLPVLKRPLLMARLFAGTRSVAVGGTGGKSTTTGMIGRILDAEGMDPTIMNGAIMLDYGSNCRSGRSGLSVFEADESDGMNDAVAVCPRSIAVLTNISLDHFELPELRSIFGEFVKNAAEGVVLNMDCPFSAELKPLHPRTVTFGMTHGADFTPEKSPVSLRLPGRHNTANALAALAACSLLGVPAARAARILGDFGGIQRRLELVGEARGVRVVDDFASSPAKIGAALQTLAERGGRLIAVFQPHGFQPTKMMRQGYIEVFSRQLRPDDCVIMPEIYYAGGTLNLVDGKVIPLPKDISARDLIEEIRKEHAHAYYFEERAAIPSFLAELAAPGDTIVVMGSRDESLPEFARSILAALA